MALLHDYGATRARGDEVRNREQVRVIAGGREQLIRRAGIQFCHCHTKALEVARASLFHECPYMAAGIGIRAGGGEIFVHLIENGVRAGSRAGQERAGEKCAERE